MNIYNIMLNSPNCQKPFPNAILYEGRQSSYTLHAAKTNIYAFVNWVKIMLISFMVFIFPPKVTSIVTAPSYTRLHIIIIMLI